MRILLIEDDESLCQGISFHLKSIGYIVDYCLDGQNGLHFALQGAYVLILLDRRLPSLNGLSLLKKSHFLPKTQIIYTPCTMKPV